MKKAFSVASALVLSFGAEFGVVGQAIATDATCSAELSASTCSAHDLSELQLGLGNSNVLTINVPDTITVSEDTTISLGNKRINSLNNKNVFNVTNGTLTVEGGANGEIDSSRYIAMVDGADSAFVLNSGTLTATTGYGVYTKNGASATINGGKIDAYYAAFSGNGSAGEMNFYVNGGTLKSRAYPAIYMPGQVNLVVTDGILEGGIVARMGQISISGGEIKNQANAVADDGLVMNYAGSMPSMSGEAITVINGTYSNTNAEYGNTLNLSITGGAFDGDIVVYDLGRINQAANLNITGGNFNGSVVLKDDAEEIGFSLPAGYTAGLNASDVSIEISGGIFETEPTEFIAEGYEAVLASAFVSSDPDFYVILKENLNIDSDDDESENEVKTANEAALAATASNLLADFRSYYGSFEDDSTYTKQDEDGASDTIEVVDSEALNEAIRTGAEIDFVLESSAATDLDDEGRADILAELPENATLVESTLIDYDINVKVGNTVVAKITSLADSIELSFDVSSVTAVADGYTRTWYVVYEHDGEIKKLAATYDADSDSVNCDTNEFSTYMVAYKDTQNVVVPKAPDTGIVR